MLNFRFNGEIDEVRIWNIALSSAQIGSLYNDEFTDPTTISNCLVAYYNFNENSGFTASDDSGNGNNGSLINMTNNDWVSSEANISEGPSPTCPWAVLVDDRQLVYGVNVYPNPSSKFITIQIDDFDFQDIKLHLINNLGARSEKRIVCKF